MAAIAIAMLAIAPVSAEAADMTLRGRFTCNDGQPLADMRVELMRTRSRLLPEIWPNQTVESAGRTGPNGEWEWRVRGGETNWRVRAVLVNNDVGVKDFPTTWHHYHDTLRTQNNRRWPTTGPRSSQAPNAACGRRSRRPPTTTGRKPATSNPAGKVTVLDNAPTSGVPFTPLHRRVLAGELRPDRNIGTAASPVMRSVAQHEFAHSFRHQLDGDEAHFTFDSARFWDLRSHSATSCSSTNHGFAFNEGWAEYWADEVQATPCTNSNDFSIERNVAFEFKRLVGRARAWTADGWSRCWRRTAAGSTRSPTSATRWAASRPSPSSRPARRRVRRARWRRWSRPGSGRGEPCSPRSTG